MTDLGPTIIAKSDQLNADDLIAGGITVKITKVSGRGGDQPISVHYEGDQGKPWKPCKGMRRVLVQIWGKDGSTYAGRKLTLFREPTVKWAGAPVGGIQISHMSDLKSKITLALTVSKGMKRPFVVQPLVDTAPATQATSSTPNQDITALVTAINTANTEAELAVVGTKIGAAGLNTAQTAEIKAGYSARLKYLKSAPPPDDGNEMTQEDYEARHGQNITDAG